MIDVRQVITSAKMQLRIESADSDAWFENLVHMGMRHVDSLDVFVKQVRQLPIKDGVVCLPKGFRQLIAFRTGVEGACSKGIYVDMPFIKNCGCSINVTDMVQMEGAAEIQNDKLVFHTETTDTECTLAYMGLNVDDNGIMLIPDDYERGLTAFVCWKYTQQNFEQYPITVSETYRREWLAQKKWLRSVAVQNDFRNTRRQISEVVKALVSDKIFNV